ncbi:HD domain-containing protein [Schaalia sp. JY-X169]|uniref:HD domain-containing protein n=1 Tax=Schaalia sp. JY-X169 TaxID=2758572 RepID=UPI0015F44689|nr:HD domain-containing protein [Schaalia sp. JY-X169]
MSAIEQLITHWARVLQEADPWRAGESTQHGADHAVNVLILALKLAEALAIEESELETIAQAAVFHDIGLQGQAVAIRHGALGATRYQEFCAQGFVTPYNAKAAQIIRYHSIDDAEGIRAIRANGGTDADVRNYLIVKDANSLDRLRFGDHRLDVSYLRHQEAHALVPFARILNRDLKAARARQVLETIATANDYIASGQRIQWAPLAAQTPRYHWPVLFAEIHEHLSIKDRRLGLAEAYPVRSIQRPPEFWIPIFRSVGRFVVKEDRTIVPMEDNRTARRGQKKSILYRGARDSERSGLSWTPRLIVATQYATHWRVGASLWETRAPQSAILAFFKNSAEAVLDPTGLQINQRPISKAPR